METQYMEILSKVAEKAAELKLQPEDLALALIEGCHLNCPEIYQVLACYFDE